VATARELDVAGRRLRAGLFVPVSFVLLAAGTFVALGTWQLERKAWKEGLIETLEQRSSAPPVELPPAERWQGLRQADEEFRRVKLAVQFQSRREALVYTGGSAFRPDIKAPGYFVFAPARTREGGLVVINRGYVPQPKGDPGHYAAPAEVVEIVGALRWPEAANRFVRPYDPASDTWFTRDHLAMAVRNAWGAVAPFYLEMEGPQPTGLLPRAGALRPRLRNEHLQYAITWYGLAVAVVVMFGFWLFNRRSRAA
jgi:cytochrome oxidase assembly protein ShyY1